MSNNIISKGFWIPSKLFFYLVMTSFIVFSLVVAYFIKSVIPATTVDVSPDTQNLLQE